MVLIFTLIILVLMTMGGLALMRSMDTTNLIAGNMAFQQAALHSADAGVETAIAWLETSKANAVPDNADPSVLNGTIASVVGYSALAPSSDASLAGESFWNAKAAAGICFLPMTNGVCALSPGVSDESGNTISFMIQRLCSATGPPIGNGCATLPGTTSGPSIGQGNNEGAGEDSITPISASTAVYYRITVRVNGPRNTISFVQAVVLM